VSLHLDTEPTDEDRLADLIPDYWQRRFMAEQVTNTYLRTVIRGAVMDLESDRPRDHIAGALSAALDSF
jgi:hypothetical protein